MPVRFLSNKLVYITPAWPTIQPSLSLSLIAAVSSDMSDTDGEADLFVLDHVTHFRITRSFSAPTYPVQNNFPEVGGH